MRQIGWVEVREDFWLIVALSRSEDETEIQFRLSGKRSLLSNGANGTSDANADANGDANTPE
jgi:hypothetical protein